MTPELSTEELQSLHKEATDLYDTYFRSNAKHKVNVSQDIAMNIFKSECCIQFRLKLRSYIPSFNVSTIIKTVYIIL